MIKIFEFLAFLLFIVGGAKGCTFNATTAVCPDVCLTSMYGLFVMKIENLIVPPLNRSAEHAPVLLDCLDMMGYLKVRLFYSYFLKNFYFRDKKLKFLKYYLVLN